MTPFGVTRAPRTRRMDSSPDGSSRQTWFRSRNREGQSVSGLTRKAPLTPKGALTRPMTRSHGSSLFSAIALGLADFDDHTILDHDL